MRVLIISAVFPPEPVTSAKLTLDIAHSISRFEKVTVISPKPSRPHGFVFNNHQKKYGFEHLTCKSFVYSKSGLLGRILESLSFGIACSKYIFANHSDIKVIYVNTWPFFSQYLTIRASKILKIPVIMHIQDIYPESFSHKTLFLSAAINRILIPIDKYYLKQCKKVITISDRMCQYLSATRALDKKKIYNIPNWQDEHDFVLNRKLKLFSNNPKTKFTFMYLGNLGPIAGIESLLDSFKLAMLNNCRLIIAGSGSCKNSLINKANKLQHADIQFWDVPDGKVAEIQDFADVMILPLKKGSALSSIPSKLIAYMLSAKPVIASVDEDSDTADILKDSQCGWIIPPESISEMTKCLHYTSKISNEELLQIGENGFLYAMQNLSKESNLPRIINCIIED